MTITEQVRDQALRLSIEDRALLARDLLESLEPHDAPEVVEAAWLEEIEGRAEAYEGGQMAADDWQASLERARQRLRERRPA
jgi:putative addiction module component (TIGR02574 family)